jgi:hypothetical protein
VDGDGNGKLAEGSICITPTYHFNNPVALVTGAASRTPPPVVSHRAFLTVLTCWQRVLPLNAQREGGSKVLSGPTQARRYETTFRPDEAHVSDVAYKFVENRDHVRMAEFIGKRDCFRLHRALSQMRRKDAKFVDLSLVGAKVSGGRSMVPNGDWRVADIAIWHLVILFVMAEDKHSRKVARIVTDDHGLMWPSEQR